MAGHDAVINLATHIPSSTLRMLIPRSWRENDRIRRDGSACLVDAALRAGIVRFLQESFAPAYPDCGSRWITEDTPLAPARYKHEPARCGTLGAAFRVERRCGCRAPLRGLLRSRRATVAALQVHAGAYNVVDDEPLTRREYFDALAQALDVAPPRLPPAWLKHVFGSTGELLARSQRMSNDKLRQATGWTPRYRSAREGWRDLAATLEDAAVSRAVD